MRSVVLWLGLLPLAAGCPTRDHLLANGADAATSTSISITAPTSPLYTNGSVSVAVSVEGRTETSIVLQANGGPIATLAPTQNTFQWDTTTTPEGSYDVTAETVVGGRTVVSDPVTIVVDRTAPTITSLTPAPGATSVVFAAPIQVMFSEPLVASTIKPSFVAVSAGAMALPTTLVLGAGGRTATIAITDHSSLSLPATLTATLSATGITDLAGNPLAVPPGAWTWTVPDWIKLAPLASTAPPQLAVGPDSHPVVAYEQCVGGGPNGCGSILHVAVNDGQAWNDLGTPGPQAAIAPSLAVNSQSQPVLSWTMSDSTGTPAVEVATWNGSSWSPLPTVGDAVEGGTSIDATVLRLDGADNPVIGWKETLSSMGSDVFVARWNGAAWDSSLGQLGLGDVQSFDVQLDATGDPAVGFISTLQTGAAIWSGSGWSMTPFIGARTPFVGFDGSGNPLMLQTGSGWIVEHLTNNTWLPAVSSPVPVSAMSVAPHLTTSLVHQPIVGWIDQSIPPSKVGLARWTGSKWDTRAGLFNAGSGPAGAPPAIVVDPRGSLWLAWSEDLQIQVWMSNY
jgi:hypothetical protein